VVGVDLGEETFSELPDPSKIITVKINSQHTDKLKRFPNLLAVSVCDGMSPGGPVLPLDIQE